MAHLPHVVELWILEVFSDSWICSQFGFCFWSTEHVSHSSTSASRWSCSCLHIVLQVLDSCDDLLVLGVDLEPFVVGGHRFLVPLEAVESHGFSLMAFVPVGFDGDALVSVLESGLVVLQIVVGGRSVTVNGVIARILCYGLGVVFDGFLEVLLLESSVSQFFWCTHILIEIKIIKNLVIFRNNKNILEIILIYLSIFI